MQNLKTITIKNYLTQKDIPFKETNGELVTTCVFCDKENHLYFNAKTGQYDCKVCGEKGNIFTLAEHFGDEKKDILLNQIQNKNKGTKNNAIFYTELANTCNEAMPDYIRQYLNQRGINNKAISQFKLGYNKFYGKQWITIPIIDNNGDIIFFKLRQDPREGNDKTTFKKNKTDKIIAQIYDWKTLKNSTDKIVICEGELDKILLQSKGVPSITSSHGALTFKDEWIRQFEHLKKVYLCFDLDNAGKEATQKIAKQLSAIGNLQIFSINLPSELGIGGGITDYFIKLKGEIKDLFEKYATEINFLNNTNRVTKIGKPKQEISIEQWRNTIKKHFPELLFSAEIGLSIIAQILIKDITNPFALVLVGMPSAGKTICLNFFSEIEHLTYASDKFTPASFVSNAVNRKKEDLKKIDLLPRLQYKMFLIRDLATLFSKRDDDLNECLGILTRVLDGEGLSTDGGVHGQRKYVGEYLFMLCEI